MHNVGMARTSPRQTLVPEPLTRGAFRHEVVNRLLVDIFQGHLPSGTRLRVMKLAEQLGISSTPVREALVELESIGVIEFIHNRGAMVKPWGPRQLAEIYQLRRILESDAARAACGNVPANVLDGLHREMRELTSSGRAKDWSSREMEADRRLHETIASACGNARLAEEIRRYDILVQAVREVVGSNRTAQERAAREHLAIIEAVAANQPDRAAEAMSEHVVNSEKAAAAAMFGEKGDR